MMFCVKFSFQTLPSKAQTICLEAMSMDRMVNRSQKITSEGDMSFHVRKALPADTEHYKVQELNQCMQLIFVNRKQVI